MIDLPTAVVVEAPPVESKLNEEDQLLEVNNHFMTVRLLESLHKYCARRIETYLFTLLVKKRHYLSLV